MTAVRLVADTPGLLTAVAGRLTGSAAIFDSNWDAGLPGNLAIGAGCWGWPAETVSCGKCALSSAA